VTAYISEDDAHFVTLTDDSTDSRYARASRLNALRRRLEKERGVQLELLATSRSETCGFMHQTSFRYRRHWVGRHRGAEVIGETPYAGRHEGRERTGMGPDGYASALNL
jgi:hypothetical protein